jgi:tetratricopeptide (TPR) repeat protein
MVGRLFVSGRASGGRRFCPAAAWLMAVAGAMTAAGCGSVARRENAKGVQLYQQGNYQGAVNAFQKALARDPGSPDGFYNIGATYHQQAKLFARPQDMQLAEQYYRLCLARNPEHASCQRALSVLLVEEQRQGEAVANLEAWASRSPANPDPRIELARLCEENGNLPEAENHLIDALAVSPGNPRALVALGHLREEAGLSGQALANYAQALSVDGSQPVVQPGLAAAPSPAPAR